MTKTGGPYDINIQKIREASQCHIVRQVSFLFQQLTSCFVRIYSLRSEASSIELRKIILEDRERALQRLIPLPWMQVFELFCYTSFGPFDLYRHCCLHAEKKFWDNYIPVRGNKLRDFYIWIAREYMLLNSIL
jgi:hypothetical protein